MPKGYKKHPSDAVAITENVRPLTTIERSYLQTFPKGFKLKGTKSELEQMIGNAVPVKLTEYYVAKQIKAFSENHMKLFIL
ncbi:DNA cytosine methyltransferase [Thiotrichales bacterium HSG14]|nr:DNA cytosine methyltransferase [Thiotrichales bacterium HSG14]